MSKAADQIIENYNKLREMVVFQEQDGKSQEYITGTLQGVILGTMNLLIDANTPETNNIYQIMLDIIAKNTTKGE